jgi:phenylacetate-coenzyme A ligase PaaK-like adenylate-forming protein
MTGAPGLELSRILGHARDNVPYYRRLLPTGPISEQNAEEVLLGLPLLTRDRLRSERAGLWSAVGDTRTWRSARTTGTTGTPVEVILDEAARHAEQVAMARHLDSCLPGERWRDRSVMHLTLHTAATSRATASPWSGGADMVKWNLSRLWQAPDEQFATGLEAIDGNVITAMPSVLAALVDRLGAAGRVSPSLVVLAGEQVTTALTERAEAVFGCPVTSLYTMAEVGIVAHGCGTGAGYHLNDDHMLLELSRDDGAPARPGELGTVVITSTANLAMPLLRYRTADRGSWTDDPCGCPHRGRRFHLHTDRTREVLATGPGGRVVTSLNIAKLFTQLDVTAVRLHHDGPDVVVEYHAKTALPTARGDAVKATIRGLLGATVSVRLRRLSDEPAQVERPPDAPAVSLAPPTLPDPADIVAWARDRLAGEPGIAAAVLTGSALSPAATTRFSDIDLEIVVDEEPGSPRWRELATSLNRHLAGVRVTVSTPASLRHSPLVVCRLLAEHRAIVGDLTRCGITWPTLADLTTAARFWAPTARAVLWTRVTSADRAGADPVQEAWFAAKHAVDALRYHLLCHGGRVTDPQHVLRLAADADVPNAGKLQHIFDVAREHRPPPGPHTGAADDFLLTALSVVDWMRRHVEDAP